MLAAMHRIGPPEDALPPSGSPPVHWIKAWPQCRWTRCWWSDAAGTRGTEPLSRACNLLTFVLAPSLDFWFAEEQESSGQPILSIAHPELDAH